MTAPEERGSLREAIARATDDGALSFPIETEAQLYVAVQALPLVMLDAVMSGGFAPGGTVPVLVLQTIESAWRGLAERHADGGPGEGTAADTWAEAARVLRDVIARHEQAQPAIVVSSPEAEEIDPRVREAFLETLEDHPYHAGAAHPAAQASVSAAGPDTPGVPGQEWEAPEPGAAARSLWEALEQAPGPRLTDGHYHPGEHPAHRTWSDHDGHGLHRHDQQGRTEWAPAGALPPYPRTEGETIVLGPEVFASADQSVVSWQGRNYVPQQPRLGPDADVLRWRHLRDLVAAAGPSPSPSPSPSPGPSASPTASPTTSPTDQPGASPAASPSSDGLPGQPLDQPRLVPLSVQMVVDGLLARVLAMEQDLEPLGVGVENPIVSPVIKRYLAEQFRELARWLENAEVA